MRSMGSDLTGHLALAMGPEVRGCCVTAVSGFTACLSHDQNTLSQKHIWRTSSKQQPV